MKCDSKITYIYLLCTEIKVWLVDGSSAALAWDTPPALPSHVIASRIFSPVRPAPSISVLNPTNGGSSGNSALAIISFFGHISAIHALKMKSSMLGMHPIKQSYMILIFGLVLTLIIFYGLTNGFNGVEIPREYGIIPNVLLND